MLICHQKKKFHTVFGSSESQFLCDISSAGEVLIEVTQQKLHGLEDIWLVLHRVEVNRECRLADAGDGIFSTKPLCQRTIFGRINLKTGRYILIPKAPRETNVMIRTHNAHLRETSRNAGDRDWTQKMLVRAPAFVTRVFVQRVSNLQKPDNVRCKCHLFHDPFHDIYPCPCVMPQLSIRTAASPSAKNKSAVTFAKIPAIQILNALAAFSTIQS